MPTLGIVRKGFCAQAVLFAKVDSGRKPSRVPTKTNLKQLRASRGVSQSALADSIGTTLNMYGKLERGERRLNMDWLRKLATALGVAITEIVAEVDDGPGDGLPTPSLDALRAALAEHYTAVIGTEMPDEMMNDLAERMLDSVENWRDDPAAARDAQVARSVARQINRKFAK